MNYFLFNFRHTNTIEILMCENEQKPEPWKNKTLELKPVMKTKSSGAGVWAMFMKRISVPELCDFKTAPQP